MKYLHGLGVLFVLSSLMCSCTPPSDITIDDGKEVVEEGATEISMWMMDFEEWENQINISQRKQINKNVEDGIQVTQRYVSSLDFDDLIRSAYESGDVPDIYMVSYGNIYKEVKAGRAIDITSYFDSWNDLTEEATTGVNFEDKYYAYPIVMEPSTILAYRKDLLDQYAPGWTVPTTWDALLSLSSTIKGAAPKNVYPFGVPTGVALAWGSWGMQYAATGGLAINDEWTESRILEPGYEDLCQLWADLYNNRYVPMASGNYTEAIIDLADGKNVMTTCGSWSISTILNQYPELKDKVGFAVMPTFDGNQDKVTATNGGWAFVISSECEHPELAAQVIKYLVADSENTDLTVDYFTRAKFSKFSPRKSVQEILKTKAAEQDEVPMEWINTVNYVAERAILEPIYNWDISVAVEGMLEEAAMGTKISKCISDCNDEVNRILSTSSETNPRL